MGDWLRRTRWGLMVASAVLAGVGVATMAPPAHAISTGEAVGIGVGSFALGSVLAARPYGYNAYPPAGYYPYQPAPAYYPPAPAPYYPAPRSCWDPYYQRYYAC